MRGLAQARRDERRLALAAFLVLFGTMAGHTALETARDALFLAALPASRLPLVYLGIVAAGLVVARARAPWRIGAGWRRRCCCRRR